MRALIVALLLSLSACATHGDFTQRSNPPDELVVQLRYRPLGSVLEPIAVHPMFDVWEPGKSAWRRWEISRHHRAQSTGSITSGGAWGHIRQYALSLHAGESDELVAEWRGGPAQRVKAALESSPALYPYRDLYVFWPGPNSNTYARWVLAQARVPCDLDARCVGREFALFRVGLTSTRTGLEVQTAVLGVKLGLFDGIEFNVLGTGLGIDFFPPALKTPVGRLGFPELVHPPAESPSSEPPEGDDEA